MFLNRIVSEFSESQFLNLSTTLPLHKFHNSTSSTQQNKVPNSLKPDPRRVSRSWACNQAIGYSFACTPTNPGTASSLSSRGVTNCNTMCCRCRRKGRMNSSELVPLFSMGNSQKQFLLCKPLGCSCSCSFNQGTFFCRSSRRFCSSNSSSLRGSPALVPRRRIGGFAFFFFENIPMAHSQKHIWRHSSSIFPVMSENTR